MVSSYAGWTNNNKNNKNNQPHNNDGNDGSGRDDINNGGDVSPVALSEALSGITRWWSITLLYPLYFNTHSPTYPLIPHPL